MASNEKTSVESPPFITSHVDDAKYSHELTSNTSLISSIKISTQEMPSTFEEDWTDIEQSTSSSLTPAIVSSLPIVNSETEVNVDDEELDWGDVDMDTDDVETTLPQSDQTKPHVPLSLPSLEDAKSTVVQDKHTDEWGKWD